MNNKERDRILSKYNHIFKNEKKYYSKMKPLPGKIINLEEQSFFRLVNVEFKKMIGNVKSKKILDVGCGRGDLSLYLAQQGANVIGIDLSNNHIDLCKTRANNLNLKVNFMVMNAQVPDFEDNVFDIIVGSRIIHHLPDIELFTRECKRLLRKKGFITFIEPLKKNPIVELNRKIFAPKKRTKHEHPLFIKDVMIAQKIFGNMEHSEFFILSPFARVIQRFMKNPNIFRVAYKFLNFIEKPLYKINFLRQFHWQIVFKSVKIQ